MHGLTDFKFIYRRLVKHIASTFKGQVVQEENVTNTLFRNVGENYQYKLRNVP
jgi:hypothetical protein